MAGDEGAAADRRIGAHLLNWLAPKSDGPFEKVPVDLTLDTDQNLGIDGTGEFAGSWGSGICGRGTKGFQA